MRICEKKWGTTRARATECHLHHGFREHVFCVWTATRRKEPWHNQKQSLVLDARPRALEVLARRTQTPILVQTGRGAGTCALRACAMSVVAEGEGLEKHHAVLLATVRRRERSGSRATAMKRTSRPRPADSRNDRTPFVKYQVFQSWLLWRHRSTPAGAGSAGTTRGRSAATVVRFVLCFFRCPC